MKKNVPTKASLLSMEHSNSAFLSGAVNLVLRIYSVIDVLYIEERALAAKNLPLYYNAESLLLNKAEKNRG